MDHQPMMTLSTDQAPCHCVHPSVTSTCALILQHIMSWYWSDPDLSVKYCRKGNNSSSFQSLQQTARALISFIPLIVNLCAIMFVGGLCVCVCVNAESFLSPEEMWHHLHLDRKTNLRVLPTHTGCVCVFVWVCETMIASFHPNSVKSNQEKLSLI